MTITTSIASTTGTSAASTALSQQSLGSTDFLRLMSEQMKQQDPFAPQDNSQMIAQLATIASSSGITDLNSSMRGIAAKLDDQTKLLQSLVDRLLPTTTATPATTAA